MKRINIKTKKFNTLSWPERRRLLAAMAWLPLFMLGLRILGLHRFQTWLNKSKTPAGYALSPAEIQRMATLVNIAAGQAFIPATCLTRSLFLGWLLQRHGVSSQLRIGVRITQGSFSAHAWIEVAGVPVNEQPSVSEQFTPFAEILPLGAFQSS